MDCLNKFDLSLFVDSSRSAIDAPHLNREDKCVISTDGSIIVVVPIDYMDGYMYSANNFPDYKRCIPEHNRKSGYSLLIQDILRSAKNMPREDDYEACRKCSKDGGLYDKNGNRVMDCPKRS